MPLAIPSSAEVPLTSATNAIAHTVGGLMTILIRGAISAVLGVALVTGNFFELACSNLIRTFSMTFSGSWGLLKKTVFACIKAEQITRCVSKDPLSFARGATISLLFIGG